MFYDPISLCIFSLFSVTTLGPNIGTVCDWKQSWGGVSIEGGDNFFPLPTLALTVLPFLSSPFPQGKSAAGISELGTLPSNL